MAAYCGSSYFVPCSVLNRITSLRSYRWVLWRSLSQDKFCAVAMFSGKHFLNCGFGLIQLCVPNPQWSKLEWLVFILLNNFILYYIWSNIYIQHITIKPNTLHNITHPVGGSGGSASGYNADGRGFAPQTGPPFIGSPSLNGYWSLTWT